MSVFEQIAERGHERVCFHHDPATGLKAIIAVHNTVLGNTLGGTRRWYYESEADALYDVLRLSQGMTYKSAGAGLPMGGAKSLIMLPKPGHKATEAEARAMGRFVDTFNGVYIAAEDVGVPSLVEAAVDDVHIWRFDVPRPDPEPPSGPLSISAAPNPFEAEARLAFSLPRAGVAHLTVLDVQGRRVRLLLSGQLDGGPHSVAWDGRNDDGRRAANGLYLVRLESEGSAVVRRLVRIR